jgi:hypothetical protein
VPASELTACNLVISGSVLVAVSIALRGMRWTSRLGYESWAWSVTNLRSAGMRSIGRSPEAAGQSDRRPARQA